MIMSNQLKNRFDVVKFERLDDRDIMGFDPGLDLSAWTAYRARVHWLDSPDEYHRHLIMIMPITRDMLKQVGDRWPEQAKRIIDMKLSQKIREAGLEHG